MRMFAVLLKVSDDHTAAYGPFNDANLATDFCDFLTAEVDPARTVIMSDPVAELLAWRKSHAMVGALTVDAASGKFVVDTTGWAPGAAKSHAQICRGGDFWRQHGEYCICECSPCLKTRTRKGTT